MGSSAVVGLAAMTILGVALIGGVLVVRKRDQRWRDARRAVVTLGLPRGIKDEAVEAVVRAVIGLAPARSGLAGQDAVVFEVAGTKAGITHRLHLPAPAAGYIVGQLRASVPGIAVTEVDEHRSAVPIAATELKRRMTPSDLAASDPAMVSRTILAAVSGLRGQEEVTWQLVVMGGVAPRPVAAASLKEALLGAPPLPTKKLDEGVVRVTIRIGASAGTDRRAYELVTRLRRAAGSVSAPNARLVPRLLPRAVVARAVAAAATPITAAAVLLQVDELVALLGWPIDSPLVPGLTLGGSPQLPVPVSVPRKGRVLGRSSVDNRRVAQPLAGARTHTLIIGPTGSGKTWLAARMFLDDVKAGRGGMFFDPKGGAARAILERLPEDAIGRTIVIDPTDDARPVPVPLLGREAGGIPELAADNLVALLRHRYRDLGPRSTDILAASLYALARVPDTTLMDLLPLWGDPKFRSFVAGKSSDDPVLASFFAWFEALGSAERNFVLAAPMNKIRPLLQRPVVRNVLAAPRTTFNLAEVMRERLAVIVMLPEGVLGSEAVTLLGQALVMQVWSAAQGRRSNTVYNVTIDEAPRFLDMPSDFGEMLARSREYGVGLTLIGQALAQFPTELREVALNSARTKIAFGTSAKDARALAAEFGPGVEADYFTGLAPHEAIGVVGLGPISSSPFTFRTEDLEPPVGGRAKAIRAASRERWGIERAEIEASLQRRRDDGGGIGDVGRRSL